MTDRIDSIYCFDYTNEMGYYDSIRDFSSEEMTYIGLALSTPKVHVSASPDSFDISPQGSTAIRGYVISQINHLREVDKNLAVNSPKYILIRYFDNSERYFEYNESFCELFKVVFRYRPIEKDIIKHESPIALQASTDSSYTPPIGTYQSPYQFAPKQKHNSSAWLKIFIGFVIACLVIGLASYAFESDDNDPIPLAEPISGAILSGNEVYNGSEITITASSSESCVVKLKTSSDIERLSFYVRAGHTVTVGVPTEYLYVYFASGKNWYGTTDLFGKNTSYSMDNKICDFVNYTWEYKLYPSASGNFSQTPIDANKFK